MATYEGKGQPPVSSGWFGNGPGWWGGSRPDYVGSEPAATRRKGALAYATGPTSKPATTRVPAPLAAGSGPADDQPSRTIAIVIPRGLPTCDLKR